MPIRTARAGKPTGVWELEALQAAIDRGEVLPTDLVWTSGFPDWKQLSSVAQEIGIMLPAPVGDVPPIPGSEAPVPPPIPKVDSGTQPVTPTEIANFGDLTFRKDTSKKSGCRGAMFSLAKILAVVIVGSIALLFVFARIQGNSESQTSSKRDQSASSSGANEEASDTASASADGESSSAAEPCAGTGWRFQFAEKSQYMRRSGNFEDAVAVESLIGSGQYSVISKEEEKGAEGDICRVDLMIEGTVNGTSYGRTTATFYRSKTP